MLNIKCYDIKGNIIYELKNGNGYVKEYDIYNNKLIYEGNYLNGEKNGEGKKYLYENGNLIFEGEYLNGKKWNGKGYDKNSNILYELKDGKGYIKEYKWNNHLIFEGQNLNTNGKVF